MGIDFKGLTRFGYFEYFFEGIEAGEAVGFARPETGWDVFDALGFENKFGAIQHLAHRGELIDDTFDVELAQHVALARLVEAEKPDIMMDLALRIFLLRRIGRGIANLQKRPAQLGLVGALSDADAMPAAWPRSLRQYGWHFF